MSIDKNLYEAKRWLRTGEDDLEAATVLRKNNKFPKKTSLSTCSACPVKCETYLTGA